MKTVMYRQVFNLTRLDFFPPIVLKNAVLQFLCLHSIVLGGSLFCIV